MKWKNFLLIACIVFNICFAYGKSKADNTWFAQKECLLNSRACLTQLENSIQFHDAGHDNLLYIWQLNDFIFKCDYGVDYEVDYPCRLYLNETETHYVNSNKLADINDLSLYLFQSAAESYPYQVILVEGQAEYGTVWYYAMVLKKNEVINAFFIDRRRFLLSPTKEYLVLHPQADEVDINPKEFISIFIDGDQQIIFKLDEKYLVPENGQDGHKGFTCMERVLHQDTIRANSVQK